MNARLILPSAGLGKRLGCDGPKALVRLGGEPMLVHTLRRFAPLGLLENAIVVVTPGHETVFAEALEHAFPGVPFAITPGGAERQLSVQNALARLDPGDELVAIHDAARPFIRTETIRAALAAAADYGAATVAVPAIDTVLVGDTEGMLVDTPDRSRLWACQTPQTFRAEVILQAHAHARERGWTVTDDATLARMDGARVKLVPGAPENLKITTPFDLRVAEALLEELR